MNQSIIERVDERVEEPIWPVVSERPPNLPFNGWPFWRVSSGVSSRWFRFRIFRPWRVWCWGALLPGRFAVWCWVVVLVLIPTGESWTPTPTRPGTKRRQTHRASQPGEVRRGFRVVFITALPGDGFFGGFLPGGLLSVVSCCGFRPWFVVGAPAFRGGLWFRVGLGCWYLSLRWNVRHQHQSDQGRNRDEPAEPANPGRHVFLTALSGICFFGGPIPGPFRGVFVFCVSPLVGLVLGCHPSGGGLCFRVGLGCWYLSLRGDVGPQHQPNQGRNKDEPAEPANPGRRDF